MAMRTWFGEEEENLEEEPGWQCQGPGKTNSRTKKRKADHAQPQIFVTAPHLTRYHFVGDFESHRRCNLFNIVESDLLK